jgi:hypothetical protein
VKKKLYKKASSSHFLNLCLHAVGKLAQTYKASPRASTRAFKMKKGRVFHSVQQFCLAKEAAHTPSKFKVPGLFTLSSKQAVRCNSVPTHSNGNTFINSGARRMLRARGESEKRAGRNIPGVYIKKSQETPREKIIQENYDKDVAGMEISARRPRAPNSLFNLLKLFHSSG